MIKEWKKAARLRMKKCYWLLVALCLLLAMTGIDYDSSIGMITGSREQSEELSLTEKIIEQALITDPAKREAIAARRMERLHNSNNKFGIVAVGHSRGVFAELANGFASGKIVNTVLKAIGNIANSHKFASFFFILAALIFYLLVKIFILNLFEVTARRAAMELRMYDSIPMNRFLFLITVKKVWNVAKTMFLKTIYEVLWSITIIGGIIKSFSYLMVPYILAENPAIAPKEAITLSRKMMDGHKWEAFKLSLSFIGWFILEFLTFGLSGVLFSNPYQEMTFAEYYYYIRTQAKEKQIPGAELLNDTYLFEFAEEQQLKNAYSGIRRFMEEAKGTIEPHKGIRGFLEKNFGMNFDYDADEIKYQELKSKQIALKDYRMVLEKKMYPSYLFPIQDTSHLVRLSPVQYERHYSITSLILIFFFVSFVGWCWEGSLHLIADGTYVNRGILHGPWLPIYGFGGVFILIILYRLRQKPILEFISAIVLCGILEYFTAVFLEYQYDGTKWWDYSGYFLNIHGRVCAEGLLVFGLGGIAAVYLIGPFLDNHFRKIPKKIAIVLASALLIVYAGDMIYSNKHPNTGDGITNYTGEVPQEETGTVQTEVSIESEMMESES